MRRESIRSAPVLGRVLLGCAVAAGAVLAARPSQESKVERGWRDQRATLRLGSWYPQLRRQLNPAQDEWWTEVVALAAERSIADGIQAVLRTRSPAGTIFDVGGESFRGCTPLEPAPDELQVLRDDATWRVERWLASSAAEERALAPDLDARLLAWLAPLEPGDDARLIVEVVASTPIEGRRFETEVDLRVGGSQAGTERQDNVRWRLSWTVPSGGEGLLLEELRLLDYERVVLRAPLYAELTRRVLADGRFAAEDLMLGAPEQQWRADQTAGASLIHIGMHGMAVGDVNGDGMLDLYVGTQAGRPNALFLQSEDGRLREVSGEAGVDLLDDTAGVLIVDVDDNGWRDLVLAVRHGVMLLYNEGPCRFERRQFLACPGTEQVYSISAADPDGDGDLDLYATRYVQGGVAGGVPTPYHDARNGASNAYFRNDEGSFVDATEAVGLGAGNSRFSLASIWEDMDGDGDLDLYVANDFGMNNDFRNEGGVFRDVAPRSGAADMAAGMGVSIADVELDGDLDLYVSNMFSAAGSRIAPNARFMPRASLEVRAGYVRHARGNTLLLARGDGTYDDASSRARVAPGGWAWGAMFTDFENDGLPDLLVPNGFITTYDEQDLESFFWRAVIGASPIDPPADQAYKHAWVGVTMMSQDEGLSWNGRERNYAFSNLGQVRFADVSRAAGLDQMDDARVACIADWDGDGRLDVWLRNRTAPILRFLHGRAEPSGAWIAFDLVGRAGARHAVGSLVSVECGERRYLRRVYAGEGYLGGSCHRLHFGLGTEPEARSKPVGVDVRWGDGSEQSFGDLQPGRVWRLEQGASARELPARRAATLAELPPDPLPTTLGAPLARLPMLDKLPFRSFPLHAFDGPERRVGDFDGRPLLVVVWSSWSEGSQRELARLAAGARTLRASGVALWPLAFDTVREEAESRRRIAALGLESVGGRLEPGAQIILEAVFLEVLGNFEDLGVPLGMLFDGAGALSVVYFDALDPEIVAEDARRLEAARERPGSRWTTALTGGFWGLEAPERRLPRLQRLFSRGGYSDLAREMAEEAREREGDR